MVGNQNSEDHPTGSAPRRAVGFVGLAGLPNVGKSTLVNRLVGQKISAVSRRPQTTRERIHGIVTDESMQVALVDIPGVVEPTDALGECLMDSVARGIRQCDLVLHLRDARRPDTENEGPVFDLLRKLHAPVWLVWNKVDRLDRPPPSGVGGPIEYDKVFAISARTGRGLEPLRKAIGGALPHGPLLYDPDQLCDRDLRYLVAELVREQLFRHLGQEIPYATATQTERYEEADEGKIHIRVMIVTERRAHKPIIIGRRGAMLKKIGHDARLEIERLVGRPIYLELWVKVVPKWRKNKQRLAELGLRPRDFG